MKQLKYILAFLLLANIIACEEAVTFTEPQPTGTPALLKFPKRLRGNYLNVENNSTLIIDDKFIQRAYDFDQKMSRNKLDSNSRISGDTLINLKTKEKFLIRMDSDSITYRVHLTDTLFQIDDEHVVKKFRGYYFLNSFDGDGWEVMKLEQSNGQVALSTIAAGSELDDLREITESAQDTVAPRQFVLTKNQFQAFIKKGGFSEGEVFIKQKKK
ncbi:hypothetical protein BH11BAC7_BH11BAC7_09880 [soil metagenome]